MLLTWLRVALIPIFVMVFGLSSWPYRNECAALIFTLAGITDWLDGYLARRWGQVSSFGAFLDPVADKLMVMAALVLLVESDRIPSWLGVVIIGREIAVSAMREWMSKLGKHQSVSVAFVGKVKTAVQMVATIGLLWYHPALRDLSYVLMLAAAWLTLWSMFVYIRSAWLSIR